MKDNEEFLELFRWLIGPMNNILFDGIEKHLLEKPRFINSKGNHKKLRKSIKKKDRDDPLWSRLIVTYYLP